jgi:hypothetical protein
MIELVTIQRVLVAPLAFSDETYPDSLQSVIDATAQMRAWYLEASYGKCVLDCTVAPIVTLPVTRAALEAGRGGAITLQSPTLLAQAGFRTSDYDKVMLVTARIMSVGFKGICYPPSSMWVNCAGSDYAPFAMIHEMGHTWYLQHAASVRNLGTYVAPVDAIPGRSVQTGGSVNEVGDTASSMAYVANFAHFPSNTKAALGWITPEEYVTGDKTYQLTPLAVAGGKTYAVKIVASARRTYWIEYRKRVNFDSRIMVQSEGIHIRTVDQDFIGPAEIGYTGMQFDAHEQGDYS